MLGTFRHGRSYDGVKIIKISRNIHSVRGQKVMIDSDLAQLYGVTTGNLNKAVNRNPHRLPNDFMFTMTKSELENLRFQFGISSWGGRRFKTRAFTQEGVAMLSSVLNSERAVAVNIAIMRAFVELRRALKLDAGLAERLEKAETALVGLEKEQGEQAVAIHELFAAFRRLEGGAG